MPFRFLYCAPPSADLWAFGGGRIDLLVGGFGNKVKDQIFVCTVWNRWLTFEKQVFSVSKVTAVCVLMFWIIQGSLKNSVASCSDFCHVCFKIDVMAYVWNSGTVMEVFGKCQVSQTQDLKNFFWLQFMWYKCDDEALKTTKLMH